MDSYASPEDQGWPGLCAVQASLSDAVGGSPGGYPSPQALFQDPSSPHAPCGTPGSRSAPEQPGSWPRRKADDDDSLTKTVCDAAARGDFLAVERLAIKLLSLARLQNAAGISEMASPTSTVRRAELTGLSAHSRRGGGAGSVNFSPFITSVGQSAHGQLKADLVPSGLKGAVESIYQDSVARADATRLLALLEPFLVTASYHFKISCNSPRTTPILGPGAQVNTAELRDIIIKVSNHCKRLTLREPRLLALESPCHVLGDLHGNLVDLNFFKTVLWPAGPSAAAGSFLFLGDFVDRGPDSIAVVAYVMAMKCLEPSRWWAIRGNHETREVNGNTDHYGSGSFLWQSLEMFGEEGGHGVWEAVNGWFDALPLAATIDNAIFCVHGGIPQALCEGDATLDRISQVPCPLQTAHSNQMVYDMLWSDPSTTDQEDTGEIGNGGFGQSPRGCGCFGDKSISIFLEKYNFQHIFRGHEAQKSGVGVSKNARLTTIFSTSKDHFKGDLSATCGCVLVRNGIIVPIVRSVTALPLSARLGSTDCRQSVEATERPVSGCTPANFTPHNYRHTKSPSPSSQYQQQQPNPQHVQARPATSQRPTLYQAPRQMNPPPHHSSPRRSLPPQYISEYGQYGAPQMVQPRHVSSRGNSPLLAPLSGGAVPQPIGGGGFLYT